MWITFNKFTYQHIIHIRMWITLLEFICIFYSYPHYPQYYYYEKDFIYKKN